MIPLGAGDVRAAQAAGAGGLDALRAVLHRHLDAVLHGAAEGSPLLQALGDGLGHQLGVGLGVLDLDDIQGDLAAGQSLKLLLEGLHVGAALADHHAGLGGVHDDVQLRAGPLDVDAADAGVGGALAGVAAPGRAAVGAHDVLDHLGDHLADLVIFDQVIGKILFPSVPFGAPVQDDTNARAMGINFLSHFISSLTSGRARS